MDYFTPLLNLPATASHERLVGDKFGGLPEGLPSRLWPRCAECGGYQSFSAQFEHHAERLDLGREGRRLYLFQCAADEMVGVCETWDAQSGANAALIFEPEDLVGGPTPLPEAGLKVENEVFIRGWVAHDDDIAPDRAPMYLSDEARLELTDDELDLPGTTTQLAGVPFWVQGAEEIDHSQWRFVAQLDSFHVFDNAGKQDAIDAANYGGGLAYVFVERNPAESTPRAAVFWQCG